MRRSALLLWLVCCCCLSYCDPQCGEVALSPWKIRANCREMRLSEVPHDINSDVEIIDLKVNRITELSDDSFVRYTSLQILILQDNLITSIAARAFSPLYNLEILDLSWNNLSSVPEAVVELPVLTTLCLGNNPLSTVVFPFMPSLQHVALDFCKMQQLPELSQLPSLQSLNVSNNRLSSIDIHKVAPLCRLGQLDVRFNPELFHKECCQCHLFSKWVVQRNVTVLHSNSDLCQHSCEGNKKVANVSATCNDDSFAVDLKLCEVMPAWPWIVLGSCLVVLLICIIGVLELAVCKRRRKCWCELPKKKNQKRGTFNFNREYVNLL